MCYTHYVSKADCTLSYDGAPNGTVGTYAVALTLEDYPPETKDFINNKPFSNVGLQFTVEISKMMALAVRSPSLLHRVLLMVHVFQSKWAPCMSPPWKSSMPIYLKSKSKYITTQK